MKNWSNLVTRQRLDAVAEAIQRLCLLVVIAVELLFFIPGEAVDEIVYLFLEWRLVDVSLLFLAASFCRRYLRQSKWYFLSALLVVIWFYLLRGVHLRLEGINQDPGAFVCAYLLCLPFAAAANDAEKGWGLKALASVFTLTGAVFGVYALLLVTNHLPSSLDGFVFWDGARFGVMGHPNICATILMISVGLSAGLAVISRHVWLKCLMAPLTALEFWAISLTNSRAAIVLTCVLLGGILFCRLRGTGWKRLLPALAAAAAVMVLLFCLSRTVFSLNNARLTEMARQAQQTGEGIGLTLDETGKLKTENGQGSFVSSMKNLNGRTEIWAAAVESLEDNPRILLTGTEHAGEIISPYWPVMDVQHAHNAWIQTLFQLGIPGLLAALALTALAVWNGAVLLWRNDCMLHSCVAMTTLCLMGCAMMEPYLFTVYAQFHYFDFLFMLCLGYLNQWRRQTSNGRGEIQNV
ncbi:MAG: O-antigen ligase family protein [Clostridiales bacterium]|nr:O-antigen ligase family protein [Clostridiales bacterium]